MKYIVFFIILLNCVQARAQEHYVFSPISSINGLSDNRVRTICQLPDGRMVFVTEGLVNIYDGATFRYMHYNEQLSYPLTKYSGYHRAYIDNENHLWLKNQYKLMLFDIKTELFAPNIDSVFRSYGIKKHVVNFFIDSDNNNWYLTQDDELYLRNRKNKTSSLFLSGVTKITDQSDILYDIAIRRQFLYLFYKSGLMVCYDMNTRKELYRENPFPGKNNDKNSTLMVVPFKHYLYLDRNVYNIGVLKRFNVISREWEQVFNANYWLNTLTIDQIGNCWISSNVGLWKIDQNLQDRHLLSPLQLVDGRAFKTEISAQYNDNTGGLWVGTVNRGVLYYHPDRFKFRNFGRSLFKQSNPNNFHVYSFVEYDSDILVGTSNGLFRYNKKNPELDLVRLIPAISSCEMLKKDSKQRIWVCTSNNGLFCIDKNDVRHYPSPVCCLNIYEAPGGLLYLCTNIGVGQFNPQTGEYINASQPESLKSIYSYQLTSFRKDTLLGFGDKGLFLYDVAQNAMSLPISRLLQYSSHHYHSLYTDSRGLIWIGTMDGLNVYNPEISVTRSFFEEDGLVNNSIRSITEDNNGRIWVSTSNGISCISLFPEGSTYKYDFANYNRFDGIIENEFMPRSVLRTSDNRLLWGGLDGFNEIDLSQIDSSKQSLSVPLFTKFTVSGTEIKLGQSYGGKVILKQSISSTKEIHLNYYQNFFGIEFSALNYVNPSQTYYRYMLEGADNTWQEIKSDDGVGRINYTNLSPGKYHLMVYAANNNRHWGNQYAEIVLFIHPPFWKTLWAYVIYAFILIGSVYFGISYYIRRNKLLMQKQQKYEIDQMKFSFFTNISHELRTPLTLILTPLDSILKKLDDSPLKQQLNGIYRNASELLKMVNQLLDFRKLEIKGETLNLSYCNIGEFLETISYSFNDLKSDKEIDFVFECNERHLYAYVDKDKLHKIVNNLLSNAFKFTPKGGHISLILLKNSIEPVFNIKVSDTGCGIHEVDLPQIFDRFYQAKNKLGENTGSGIGLHLLKEYVALHSGTVNVESEIDKGSTFTVTIPSNLEPENNIVSEHQKGEGSSSLKLLIVEDNTEFQKFLQNELCDKYQVIVASNGKEGLEKVHEQHPDLVISDVMMPEMTGTEFCQSIKNDIRISHIPVILLTAKASDQAQIEGFEAGADAYITKPFNLDILLLRVNHLMEQQRKRKETFKSAIDINPESFTSTNIDEELIKKALAHIETNMDNALYSVEQLSKDMFMDRTNLYRKLLAIVGQTPTEFIRSVRLKRSAQLLENGYTVTEVAEKVGFQGTTSYFAKCFQEEFGMKPSQYKTSRRI